MKTSTDKSAAPFTDWHNYSGESTQSTPIKNKFLPLSEIDGGDSLEGGSNLAKFLWEVPPTTENHTYLGLSPEERRKRKIRPESYMPVKYSHPIYPNYRRLELTNRNKWNGKWEDKSVLHPDDDWRLSDAIMCQLDMTNSQKAQTFSVLSSLDRGELGRSTRKAVFCVAMVVCWLDGRRTSPRQKPWDPEFARMARTCGVFKPLREFEKFKHVLRDRVDLTTRKPVPKPPSCDPYKYLN
jgi:hypothetical protein